MKQRLGNIVVACAVAIALMSGNVMAADGKLQKKIDRAVKGYEKTIIKAEDKSCPNGVEDNWSTVIKKCSRALKSLDNRYNKYKPEIKGAEVITALHVRHEALHKLLADYEVKEEIRNAGRHFNNTLSKMDLSCLEEDGYAIEKCTRHIERSKIEYSEIPDNMKQEAAIVALKKEYDELVAKHEKTKERFAKTVANAEAASEGKDLYREWSSKLVNTLKYLKAGKNNKSVGRDSHKAVKTVDANFSKIGELYTHCTSSFTPLLNEPEVVETCELAENKKKYRDQLLLAASKQYLIDETERMTRTINNLSKDYDASYNRFNAISSDHSSHKKSIKDQVKQDFSSLGKPEPSFDTLDKIDGEFKKALKIALKANNWDKVKYKMPAGFKNMIKEVAKKRGEKFIKAGMSRDTWRIHKNSLGIPLYKTTPGFVMFRHPEEKFERMYTLTYVREFSGNDYQEASSVKVDYDVMPIDG